MVLASKAVPSKEKVAQNGSTDIALIELIGGRAIYPFVYR